MTPATAAESSCSVLFHDLLDRSRRGQPPDSLEHPRLPSTVKSLLDQLPPLETSIEKKRAPGLRHLAACRLHHQPSSASLCPSRQFHIGRPPRPASTWSRTRLFSSTFPHPFSISPPSCRHLRICTSFIQSFRIFSIWRQHNISVSFCARPFLGLLSVCLIAH